jgi:hypothetical protein
MIPVGQPTHVHAVRELVALYFSLRAVRITSPLDDPRGHIDQPQGLQSRPHLIISSFVKRVSEAQQRPRSDIRAHHRGDARSKRETTDDRCSSDSGQRIVKPGPIHLVGANGHIETNGCNRETGGFNSPNNRPHQCVVIRTAQKERSQGGHGRNNTA